MRTTRENIFKRNKINVNIHHTRELSSLHKQLRFLSTPCTPCKYTRFYWKPGGFPFTMFTQQTLAKEQTKVLCKPKRSWWRNLLCFAAIVVFCRELISTTTAFNRNILWKQAHLSHLTNTSRYATLKQLYLLFICQTFL